MSRHVRSGTVNVHCTDRAVTRSATDLPPSAGDPPDPVPPVTVGSTSRL
jgi:hypothetical protein